MRTSVFKWIFLVLLGLNLFMGGYVLAVFTDPIPDGRTVVEAVCDYGHTYNGIEGAGEVEHMCGIAQDSINAEYICDKGGICQAELK